MFARTSRSGPRSGRMEECDDGQAAAHLGLPTGRGVRVATDRAGVHRGVPGVPSRRRGRALGPVGRLGGGQPQGAEGEAWAAARRTFDRFDSAERLLFSVPMWNASVPYVLKQFIDVISQPGWIFGIDPAAGYSHLLAGRGKRVAAVYTSAVWGPPLGREFGTDFQSTFFGDWLRWTGLTDISEIRFHPTLTGDGDAARRAADTRARDIGKTF